MKQMIDKATRIGVRYFVLMILILLLILVEEAARPYGSGV